MMPITDCQLMPCQSVADYNEKQIHRRAYAGLAGARERARSFRVSIAARAFEGAEGGRAFFQQARLRLLPRRSVESCPSCGGHSSPCRGALRAAPRLRDTSATKSAGAACRERSVRPGSEGVPVVMAEPHRDDRARATIAATGNNPFLPYSGRSTFLRV